MKIKNFLLVLGLWLSIQIVNAQTPNRLITNEAKPGSKLELSYNPAGSKLENSEKISGTIYLFSASGAYTADDLNFKKDGNVWKSQLMLPDTAVYAAMKINADKLTDNNDEAGYTLMLTGPSGKALKGANAAESVLYLGMGNYLIGMKANPEKALVALEQEMKLYPDTRTKNLASYYGLLTRLKLDDKKAAVKNELLANFNQKGASEKDLLLILNTFGREKTIADSLRAIVKTNFPNGVMITADRVNSVLLEKDAEKKASLYEQLKKDFGNNLPNEDRLLTSVANAFAAKKDYVNFKKYASLVKQKSSLASAYNSIAWKLAEEGKDLDFAADVSKQSLELVDDMQSNPPAYFSTIPPSQRQAQIDNQYSQFADTYGLILFKQGKVSDALKIQTEAVKRNKDASAEIYERYTQFLEATGKKAEAKTTIEEQIRNAKSTAKMKEQLKALYAAEKGNDSGYDVYLAGLEKVAKQKIREELLTSMLDKQAPAFSLKDLNGSPVSLTSLKGKVVVVDFWATWCGPCIASFPGMQLAVTKFKDDPNVKFVFIDTWETGAKRLENVKSFIEKNKYTFHVLMDEEKDTKHIVVSDFEVEGIPTKFVLDKNGVIRFKAVGFSGSADAIVDELTAMIEIASNPPVTAGTN